MQSLWTSVLYHYFCFLTKTVIKICYLSEVSNGRRVRWPQDRKHRETLSLVCKSSQVSSGSFLPSLFGCCLPYLFLDCVLWIQRINAAFHCNFFLKELVRPCELFTCGFLPNGRKKLFSWTEWNSKVLGVFYSESTSSITVSSETGWVKQSKQFSVQH